MKRTVLILNILLQIIPTQLNAAPSIHSKEQMVQTIHQFVEDYNALGFSLYGDLHKEEKNDLDKIFEKEMKVDVPAESLGLTIIGLDNDGSILKQKYKAFFQDLDLRDPNTYNQVVADLIMQYYNDPNSRDAVYILTQHLSRELKSLKEQDKLPQDDSVTQSILNWTMFASALIVVRDAVRERGGFLDIWNKYFRKIPEHKLIPHRNGLPPRSLEEYSVPKSPHRQKCQNWTYGNKTTEEIMQLRRILSRGKVALLGSLDSLCVSTRIGAESFLKGGLIAGGAYAFGDWEELKSDPSDLLKPFIYFSVHNLMIETHLLYEKIHELFTSTARIDVTELKTLSAQVLELKKQEQHFTVVAPELALGKVGQPDLLKSLEEYRKRWKALIVLQGVPSREKIAQVIDKSARLQKQLEQYYESLEDNTIMISLAPIQIQRELIEKELAYLVTNPK